MTEEDRVEVDCVVIGAGWTGLATAAALRSYGVSSFVLLESGSGPGHFWSRCYDRIRLHTPWHGLPCDGGLAFHRCPMFKTKVEVLRYLRDYHALHGLDRYSRFNEKVVRIKKIEASNRWIIETQSTTQTTADQTKRQYSCRYVAVCTSKLRLPYTPDVKGIETFGGRALHSYDYKTGRDFVGQTALVVGSGNSAAEIAVDLFQNGAQSVTMLVDGPRHFVPLSRLGALFRCMRWMGKAASSEESVYADWLMVHGEVDFDKTLEARDRAMAKLAVDMTPFGIDTPSDGMLSSNVRHGRIAVFDIGAIRMIRSGRINIVKGRLRQCTKRGVELLDGSKINLTLLVFATGFKPGLEEFFEDSDRYLKAGQPGKGCGQQWLTPLTDGRGRSAVDETLFFVGFDQAVNGGLSMGLWGWHAGFLIAQCLGFIPCDSKFDLNSLPERQRDFRARYRVASAVAISAVVVATMMMMAQRRALWCLFTG